MKKAFILILTGFVILESYNSAKKLKLFHFTKLDHTAENYIYTDTAHLNPLKHVSFYFSLNETELKKIDLSEVDELISSNRFIQTQVDMKLPNTYVAIYKSSNLIEHLKKKQSHKLLTLCNNDIVVEYQWEYGLPSDTFYYENGKIKGSEEIHLEDVPIK